MGQPASQRDTRGLWHITRTAIQPAYSGRLTGSVLASLGLNVPAAMAGASMPSIGLEQLLAVNPAWLLVAHYREESIVKRWQQDPLWQMLTAAQKQQVASVDSNTWARMRGILLQSVLPLTR